MMQYLVKLVRDKITENSLGDGAKFEKIKDHGTYVEKLQEKLLEEVGEYLIKPSASELGDIHEVIATLAEESHGAIDGERMIAEVARKKRDKRGGFTGRTGLYIEEKESYV